MALTTEQSRALIDAIAGAPSTIALEALRFEARRAGVLDAGGGFLEVLMALREHQLSQPAIADPEGRSVNDQTRSSGQLPVA